uniref:DNA-3-methyladenine glycosylase 1 n=2 Tax=Anthurium amnicola TaxID=1678845 RepID=A0A1D1Y3U6_9ARAE
MSAPFPSPSPVEVALPPSHPSTKTARSSPPSAAAPASVEHIPAAGSTSYPSSPTARAKSDPSSATAAPSADSACAGTTRAPMKIPSRPRKTRKLALSATAPQGGVKAEAGDGSFALVVAKGGAAPVEINNRTPGMYCVLPRPLSADGEVAAAVRRLRAADPQLARVMDAREAPVFQTLHPPFHALARSILYQQLAFKAAASIYSRFLALCGGEAGVVPETVLGLTPHQLRQIGVSARKASYLHDLANKYRNGILSDSSIVALDDKSLFTMLTMVKGIGPWSVHMFMIFSLHRPDVLPVGDLGVRKGVQLLYGLETLPRPSQMEQLCERWKPYRSVGAWYMWRLIEAKGAPAALATVPPNVAALANGAGGEGGVDGASLAVGVPPALTPLPQHQHLHPQHQHLSRLQHPHPHQDQHPHPHQHHQQLQMQPQLVDAIQSVPNLGFHKLLGELEKSWTLP